MTKAQRWDDYLIAEHELIERAMAVLKTELPKLASNEHNAFRLSRSVDFLLEFGDKIHNKKEENILFPRMEAAGIPRDGGPIAVMLMEHESERELLGKLSAAIPGVADASAEERAALAQEGTAYLQIRANHIWKENDVLYPMGRRVLSEDENARILEAFEAVNVASYGEGAHEQFVAMVEELEASSGAQTRLIKNLDYDQLHALFEALPIEVTFVDAKDQVAYFNRLDKEKIFPRTRSAIGRKVGECHPSHSVHMVREIVEGFKAGTRDKADFWIDYRGDKVMISYFPVRDDAGTYLGVLEVTQSIGDIQKLEGQKRLLD